MMIGKSILAASILATSILAVSTPVMAQNATHTTITGTVTDIGTRKPVPGVTVRVADTRYATSTDVDGKYTIANVPNGTYAIEARRVGFGISRKDNIRVTGATMSLNFSLNTVALSLQAVTVSATVDPTSGINAPFAVTKITAEQMPVAATGAASGALVGKVAGVNILRAGGAPGAGSYVQLRSPSSPFHSNSPLYVVDGVMLDQTQPVTTQDIEGMDIASIEVIKGAAAAAIYGSRAAGGVISITTNRGNNIGLGKTQITVRNDLGYDEMYNQPVKRTEHWYKVNDQGQWLDDDGNVTDRADRIASATGFVETPYLKTYDNVGQITQSPLTMQSTVSLAQNSATGNYNLSYSRNRQPGTVIESYGYLRQTLRLNIDQSMGNNFTVGLRASHIRGTENPSQISFQNLYSFDPDVNLMAKNADGSPFLAKPDSASSLANPLYLQHYRDNVTRRERTLINGTVEWRATNWLTFNSDLGYDKASDVVDNYTPPGLPSTDGESITTGSIFFSQDAPDGLTVTGSATALKDIGALTARFTLRAEQNRERDRFFSESGSDFAVAGVHDISGATTKSVGSSLTDIRVNAGTASLGLDYAGKYIGDFLLRREASSLFGPDHRNNNFYRAAVGYMMSNESWWPFSAITSFKPRYSYGTAGTRPDFSDQYADVNITSGGLVRDGLGNPNLRPEIKTEHEMGVDMIVKNRLQFVFTYARSTTNHAIVAIAAPSVTGYNTVNANVGRTRGDTYEGTIEGQLFQTKNFRWNSNFVVDRSTSTVLEYDRPCYTDGILFRCDNVPLTSFWGASLMHNKSQLPQIYADAQDQFEVNDEGYLVPVGVGNHYTDGVAKDLWGTNVTIDGVRYPWGQPMYQTDSLGQKTYTQIGNSQPKFNFGLGNRLNYKGTQLYFLVNGQVGGQIYNNVRQTLINSLDSPDVEQAANKPLELKKPYYYYQNGVTKNNSDYLQAFVESGSYAKLSEVSLSHSFAQSSLPLLGRIGADRVDLQLIGRNLYTWTHYRGNDPETAGSQLSRIDSGVYPMSRDFTASVTLVF